MDREIFIIDPIIATIGIINPCVRLTCISRQWQQGWGKRSKVTSLGVSRPSIVEQFLLLAWVCLARNVAANKVAHVFAQGHSVSEYPCRGLAPGLGTYRTPERQLLSIVIGVAIGVRKFEKQAGSTRGNVTCKCQHHLSRNSASNWAFQDKLSNTISSIHS